MTPSDISGRRSEADSAAHEDDPTGIRALLGALPPPGPMPQDLVERIEARLAVEHAHREQDPARGLAGGPDSMVDLAAERSHRRPGRTVALLGAAAAGLLVATVALGELSGVSPSAGPAFDSAAQVPARSGAGADGADAGGAPEVAAADEDAAPEVAGRGTDGTDGTDGAGDAGGQEPLVEALPESVAVLPDLGTVEPEDYHERIVEMVADGARPRTAVQATDLTTVAAGRCWELLEPAEPWPVLRAAPALMDGERVVVLLGMRDATAGQAMVMPWACTTGAPVTPLDSTSWGPRP